MVNRVNLKEFQAGLASRIKAAATEAAPSARLGFEAGGVHWLARLESAGEVLQVPEIQRVPLTREWFLGVANIRGSLYGVTDFGAFLGQEATGRGPENRLLLIGQPVAMNCAVLVSRLTGLHSVADYEPEPAAKLPAWSAATWRDKAGRVWRELDAEKLLAHQEFFEIAAQ